MQRLTRFEVTRDAPGFVLQLEDDAGKTLTFQATADQLDAIVDSLDEILEDYEEEVFEDADNDSEEEFED